MLEVEAPAAVFDEEAALVLPEKDVQKGEPNGELVRDCERDGVSGTLTAYYDENGILFKNVETYEDGSCYIEEYASNGTVTYIHDAQANGDVSEQFFDEYGSVMKRVTTKSDGTYYETIFYSNGVKASVINQYASGGYYEEYFTKSGNTISVKQVGADGSLQETTYYENGNSKSWIEDGADGYYETHWFENGRMSSTLENSARGYFEHVYHANGERALDICRYDGLDIETRYDESGKTIYAKCISSEHSYLFENGELVYYCREGREVTDPVELLNFAFAQGLVPFE